MTYQMKIDLHRLLRSDQDGHFQQPLPYRAYVVNTLTCRISTFLKPNENSFNPPLSARYTGCSQNSSARDCPGENIKFFLTLSLFNYKEVVRRKLGSSWRSLDPGDVALIEMNKIYLFILLPILVGFDTRVNIKTK